MKRVSPSVRRKADRIRFLLLDVDGVLTDGRIIIDENGVETKHFDVRDGQGIALLKLAGIEVGLISGRSSKVVRHRAKELGIQVVYQGVRNKAAIFDKVKLEAGLKDAQIAYVGDDIIDLPILRQAGLAVSVKDGWPELKPLVDYVTEASGGRGAVREIAELLLKVQGKWDEVTRHY